MKGFILCITAVSVSLASCSQDIPAGKVPSVVQNTLQSKFSNPVNVEWEKIDDLFEAEFDLNNTDHKAHIDPSGKLIIYKSNIKSAELPAPITDVISREHSGYKIDDADKLEKDGMTYYQVELDATGKQDKLLVFTSDGKAAQNITYMK